LFLRKTLIDSYRFIKCFYLAEFNGHYTAMQLYLDCPWAKPKRDQVFPILNEYRYILMQGSVQIGNGEENYGLAIAGE
jgi:hypothetical protein